MPAALASPPSSLRPGPGPAPAAAAQHQSCLSPSSGLGLPPRCRRLARGLGGCNVRGKEEETGRCRREGGSSPGTSERLALGRVCPGTRSTGTGSVHNAGREEGECSVCAWARGANPLLFEGSDGVRQWGEEPEVLRSPCESRDRSAVPEPARLQGISVDVGWFGAVGLVSSPPDPFVSSWAAEQCPARGAGRRSDPSCAGTVLVKAAFFPSLITDPFGVQRLNRIDPEFIC